MGLSHTQVLIALFLILLITAWGKSGKLARLWTATVS